MINSFTENKLEIQNSKLTVKFDPRQPANILSLLDHKNQQTVEFDENKGYKVKTLTVPQYTSQDMYFTENSMNRPLDESEEEEEIIYDPDSLSQKSRENLTNALICQNFEKSNNSISFTYLNNKFLLYLTFTIPENRLYVKLDSYIKNNGNKPSVLAAINPLHITLPYEYFRRIETRHWGYPAYLSNNKNGIVFTLDFPGMHVLRNKISMSLEYRPMHILKPDEEYKVFSSGIIFVPGGNPESARKSFHQYLNDAKNIRKIYPVQFCTWGPYLRSFHEEVCIASMPGSKKSGSDIFMLDLGYIDITKYITMINEEIAPTSESIDRVINNDAFPGGIDKIKAECDKNGLKLGLHFNVGTNHSGIDSIYDLPVLNPGGSVKKYICIASPYGKWLKDYLLAFVEKYQIDMIKMDFNMIHEFCDKGNGFYDNGYNIIDQHYLNLVDILISLKKKKPDLYIYLACGNGFMSPYLGLYIDQIHTEDPGCEVEFRKNFGKKPIYNLLAISRRTSWFDRYYVKWFPHQMIKMDIGGYAYQQRTPAALYSEDQPYVIPEGIDWQQTLFSSLSVSKVRDMRCNVLAMTDDELGFMKKWFDWAKTKDKQELEIKILSELPPGGQNPDIFMHIKGYEAVLYITPGLSDSPSWMEIILKPEHDIPEDVDTVYGQIIYPFKGTPFKISRDSSNEFKLHLPGPKNAHAIITELNFKIKFNSQADEKNIEQNFVTYGEGVINNYPAFIDIDIHEIVRSFKKQKPAVVKLGESIPFHEIKDDLLYRVTTQIGSLLSGEGLETNGKTNDIPDSNIILLGHSVQANLNVKAGLPLFEKKYDLKSIKLPDGRRFRCGIVTAYKNPVNPQKTILTVIGRTPDEVALALKQLEKLTVCECSTLIKKIGKPKININVTESVPLSLPDKNALFLKITPNLSYNFKAPDLNYAKFQKYGAVMLTIIIDNGNKEKTIYTERIVPMLRNFNHPYLLPPSRYLCLNEYAGNQVNVIFKTQALTEHSKTPVSIRQTEIVTL